MESASATTKQLVLDIGVQVQKDVNGIEMGVLENGIPYLTQNGLARIAGSARSVIYDIAQEWTLHFNDEVLGKNRYSWLRLYLADKGYNEPQLYIKTKRDGQVIYAYPDIVCMQSSSTTPLKRRTRTRPPWTITASLRLTVYRNLSSTHSQLYASR